MKINKKYSLVKLILLGALNLISSCKEEMSSHNILLQEWQGPYGGVPAFDKMDIKDIQAAVEKGMELNLAEIEAITNSSEAPTFENTIEEMERSGADLGRVFAYYGIMSSNVSSPEFREIQSNLPRSLLPCSSASGRRVSSPSPTFITKSHRN